MIKRYAAASLTKGYDRDNPLVSVDHLELHIIAAANEDEARGKIVGKILIDERTLRGIFITEIGEVYDDQG